MPNKKQKTLSAGVSDLRDALKFAMQALEARNTIPVLGMMNLTADASKGVATMTCTNLDMVASASFEADIETDFAVLLNPRTLSGMVSGASGAITIAVSAAGDEATIKNDLMTLTVRNLISVADWPAAVTGDFGKVHQISEADLHRGFSRVAPCISREETRYYLNGVYLLNPDTSASNMRLVATDGHRLGCYDMEHEWIGPNVIVSRQTVQALLTSTRAGGNRAFEVRANDRWIEFRTDDRRLLSKVIDGTYPDYTRVLPDASIEPEIDLTLAPAAVQRIVRATADVCRDRSIPIKLHPDAGAMTACVGREFEISAPISGKGSEIGVNGRYLNDFLRANGTARITSKNNFDPMRLEFEDPKMLGVLMPMRV